jgi:hypothetical protein
MARVLLAILAFVIAAATAEAQSAGFYRFSRPRPVPAPPPFPDKSFKYPGTAALLPLR